NGVGISSKPERILFCVVHHIPDCTTSAWYLYRCTKGLCLWIKTYQAVRLRARFYNPDNASLICCHRIGAGFLLTRHAPFINRTGHWIVTAQMPLSIINVPHHTIWSERQLARTVFRKEHRNLHHMIFFNCVQFVGPEKCNPGFIIPIYE